MQLIRRVQMSNSMASSLRAHEPSRPTVDNALGRAALRLELSHDPAVVIELRGSHVAVWKQDLYRASQWHRQRARGGSA
jgi:hypothetical protein